MAATSKATKPAFAKLPKAAAHLEILRAESLADVPWLVHGFSTRRGGISTCYGGRSLNLGLTHDDLASNVEGNRALFFQAVGAADADGKTWPLAQVRQVHSAIVQQIDSASARPAAGDGLTPILPDCFWQSRRPIACRC